MNEIRVIWIVKRFLICLGFWTLGFSQEALAAGEYRPMGGRASGLAGISVALSDQWSAANNQAGNAFNNGIICGVYFENRFLVKELSYKAMVFSACLKPGAFSFLFQHFGTGKYSEMKTAVAYARKFGKRFSAGIQLTYYRFLIGDGYGSKSLINCEAGLQFRPSKQLSLGFHIINPVPVKINTFSGESLASLFQLGISYNFTESLMVSAEVEKDPLSSVCARLGAECRFAGILSARAGVATGPFRLSIGAGILIKRFSLDFASEYSQVLGFSPAVSLQYQLGKQETHIRRQ
ncbi:MAG: hypothetical protein NTW31_06700 [Bacteroidetes bacterium]|nr:hypothetical protein [Bacteroidota bacterium]